MNMKHVFLSQSHGYNILLRLTTLNGKEMLSALLAKGLLQVPPSLCSKPDSKDWHPFISFEILLVHTNKSKPCFLDI